MLNRWLLVGLVALCPTLAAAQGAKTSVKVDPWKALPDSTFVAVEFNDLGGALSELRAKTKLGSVVLTEARFQSFMNLMKAEAGESWDEMTAELGKLGLSTDDLMSLAKGSGGFAFSMNPRGGEMEPLMAMTAWISCSPDKQERFVTAISRGLEEARSKGETMQRVDTQMAGYPVMRITDVVTRTDWSVEPDADGNYPEYPADQVNMLMARTPFGFVVTMNLPADRSMVRRMRSSGNPIDVAKISGVAVLEREFGRMLSLVTSGDGEGFAVKAAQVKGINSIRPAGRQIMRAVALPQTAIQLLMQKSDGEERSAMQAFAVDKIGAIALNLSLDGQVLRSTGFFESRGPKKGLFKLLDQPKTTFTVPNWVPADATSFTSFGLDLLGIFNTIKEIGNQVDPNFEAQMQQFDGMAMGFLGSDIASFLGSVGKTHAVLNFEPRIPSNVPPEFAEDVPIERMAFAIPLNDTAPWLKLLTQMGPMLGGGGEGIDMFQEERGFSGIRLSEPMEAGLYIGQGHLLIAMGESVGVDVSSALVKAPEGDQAFKGHPIMAEAQKIITWRDGMLHQVSDNDRYIKSLMQQLKMVMSMAAGDEEFVSKLMGVIPTGDEMRGVLGVSATQIYTDENGFVLESHSALGGK